jgi:hypothetical protein
MRVRRVEYVKTTYRYFFIIDGFDNFMAVTVMDWH